MGTLFVSAAAPRSHGIREAQERRDRRACPRSRSPAYDAYQILNGEKSGPQALATGPLTESSYARLVAPLIENAKAQQALNVAQQRELTRLKAEQAASNARLHTELSATNARLARLEALLNSLR